MFSCSGVLFPANPIGSAILPRAPPGVNKKLKIIMDTTSKICYCCSTTMKNKKDQSSETSLECLRCGWKWEPRKKVGFPKRCPGCYSTSWMKPRKKSLKKK
jgi:predicted Zn-ribbon and HTH transcriptional regulator